MVLHPSYPSPRFGFCLTRHLLLPGLPCPRAFRVSWPSGPKYPSSSIFSVLADGLSCFFDFPLRNSIFRKPDWTQCCLSVPHLVVLSLCPRDEFIEDWKEVEATENGIFVMTKIESKNSLLTKLFRHQRMCDWNFSFISLHEQQHVMCSFFMCQCSWWILLLPTGIWKS